MARPSKPKPAAATPTLSTEATPPVTPDPVNTPQVAPDPTGAVSAPASAAVKDAAAPVDPKPEAKPDVSTVAAQGFVLRVKGPAKGRWRAGRKFGPEPVDIPVDELSDEDLQQLHGDPELTCLVLGEA